MNSLSAATTFMEGHRRVNRGGASPFGCCGIFLILMSASLLFWNEGRAVKRYKVLVEGAKVVKEIQSIDSIDPSLEGKLVHLVGDTKNSKGVTDRDFGITDDIALKLKRSVQMYQWTERGTSHQMKHPDGSTYTNVTYSYNRAWVGGIIDSDKFHDPEGHDNPVRSLPFPSMLDTTDNVSIGAFEANRDMVDSMSWMTVKTDGISKDKIIDPDTKSKAKQLDGGFYFGDSSTYPNVGDVKVLFWVVLPSTVTIMAKQSGSTFTSYHTKAGEDLLFMERGNHTAQEIFDREISTNNFLLYCFRFLGALIMYAGVSGMLSPFAALLHAIPLVGRCIGDTLLPAVTSVVAGAFCGVVIAVAWLRFHPIAGISFILTVAYLIFLAVKKAKTAELTQEQDDDDVPIEPLLVVDEEEAVTTDGSEEEQEGN